MPRLLHALLRHERLILGVLILLFLGSSLVLLRRFYVENTVMMPAEGGTYIEGSVGQLQPLMPWFTVENDVNRDIVSLVFSGLLTYNPQTQDIEEDLATLTVSDDNRVYTLRLKENLFWHDSTQDDPHPVTADDVLFTFRTIQDPQFPNTLLRQNFLGVDIVKLGDRTVRFELEEPYRFFGSNLTLGLLPARSFDGIPVSKLDQALDFGFSPVGAGPYRFRGLVQTELSSEITIERFDGRSIEPSYHLERIVFRIFPDYQTLLSDIRNLDGVRLVPRSSGGEAVVPRNFTAIHYTLPQYVALFLNLDKPVLADQKLRLGLQLGTDKQAIIDAINESIIVDTPLLEIDVSDWRYQFDPEAAQGALFSSDWHLPEKVRLQRQLEIREANRVGALQTTPIVYLDTGASLIVTGSLLDVSLNTTVNGIPVSEGSATGTWTAALPTHGGTGAIGIGWNLLKLEDGGRTVDSFYLWRTAKSTDYRRAAEEQRLVELFVASRDGGVSPEDRVTIVDLFLEKGMLRRRLSTDPRDIRINDRGERLSLTLLTSSSPPAYGKVARIIKEQWAPLGVHVGIDMPETRTAFEQKLIERDYDVVLFGQSLLDNLDSYPYWHSSGRQHLTGQSQDLRIDAYNLSQYSSLEADTLLESTRENESGASRQERGLTELRDVLKRDVPAIFLYSPLYTFAYTRDLRGVELGRPSLHSDRFLTLHRWYLKEERRFKAGKGWMSFVPWLLRLQE